MFEDIRELKEKVEHLSLMLNRIFSLGKVVAVDEEKALVRVKLEEFDNLITYWLPVLYTKTQLDKEYWLPDIDEMVLCVFTPPAFERGFVLGSFYTKEDPPPDKSRDKWIKKFKDGTIFEYDRKNSKLSINIQKDVEINVNNQLHITSKTKTEQFQNGTLQMNSWNITGNITLNGNLVATGNIIAQSGLMTSQSGRQLMVDEFLNTYNTHNHTGDDGGDTSPPHQTY